LTAEIWPEYITAKSWRILNELAHRLYPVVIGGWAVYLWTGALKSSGVDLFVRDENLWKIGVKLSRHPRLKKYHAVIDEVDVDIYTPTLCGLVIGAAEIFEKRLYALIRDFNVILPEPLLILKCEAASKRWGGRKGFKDRCDVLSLLNSEKLDLHVLNEFLNRSDRWVGETLGRIVRESAEEYKVIGLDPWEGRKKMLKKLTELGLRNRRS